MIDKTDKCDNTRETFLTDELERLAISDRYPFHMPGHKRRMGGIGNPYEYDITEIDGFDDLARPGGILADMLEDLRALYDAGQAFLSLNGSTGSNLIGIFAATGQGDEVLVSSNCHRSVFHAAELRELKLYIIEPKLLTVAGQSAADNESDEGEGTRFGKIPGVISPDDVERAFREHPAIKLVVLTSPTYEGVVSDIPAIAEITHRYGARLFVDGAHGAHLTIANRFLMVDESAAKLNGAGDGTIITECDGADVPYFPQDALNLGADAVSVSLHKTLPMPGMSSLLLLPKTDGVPAERAAHYWQIFQSSSPSYLLMAMVDNGVRWLKANGERAFQQYKKQLRDFYEEAEALNNLYILPSRHRDPGKIIIALPRETEAILTGQQLATCLLSCYAIDIERAEENYIIIMTSVMDTDEGFSRLWGALREIDIRMTSAKYQTMTAKRGDNKGETQCTTYFA